MNGWDRVVRDRLLDIAIGLIVAVSVVRIALSTTISVYLYDMETRERPRTGHDGQSAPHGWS